MRYFTRKTRVTPKYNSKKQQLNPSRNVLLHTNNQSYSQIKPSKIAIKPLPQCATSREKLELLPNTTTKEQQLNPSHSALLHTKTTVTSKHNSKKQQLNPSRNALLHTKNQSYYQIKPPKIAIKPLPQCATSHEKLELLQNKTSKNSN